MPSDQELHGLKNFHDRVNTLRPLISVAAVCASLSVGVYDFVAHEELTVVSIPAILGALFGILFLKPKLTYTAEPGGQEYYTKAGWEQAKENVIKQ